MSHALGRYAKLKVVRDSEMESVRAKLFPLRIHLIEDNLFVVPHGLRHGKIFMKEHDVLFREPRLRLRSAIGIAVIFPIDLVLTPTPRLRSRRQRTDG